MSLPVKLKKELRSLVIAFVYFSIWIGGLVLVKKLILDEYHVAFVGWSKALLGALILSKVVLLMEPIPLGTWEKTRPAWAGIMVRTLLYSLGVLLVMLLEKGLDGRHESGGFVAALKALATHADIYHIWANTICMCGALFIYNTLDVIRENLGPGGLLRIFTSPMPEGFESEEHTP